jgi:hypothetical protein
MRSRDIEQLRSRPIDKEAGPVSNQEENMSKERHLQVKDIMTQLA